jgi:deferrochelatase/peroxidase EfeB
MARKDLLKAPLDTSQADAQIFMERTQGNIPKGHDRYHSAHIFLGLNSEARAARSWIASDMAGRLTSAKKQSGHTKAWKASRGAGETCFAFHLSYQGYVRLGVADAATPTDSYFRAGMKSAPMGASTIVAMVLIADDDRTRLDNTVATISKEVAPFCERTFVERGDVPTFDFGGGRNRVEIEYFGHQDGISQPR